MSNPYVSALSALIQTYVNTLLLLKKKFPVKHLALQDVHSVAIRNHLVIMRKASQEKHEVKFD